MAEQKASTSPSVQWFEIDSELQGQRIDNFLRTRLKGAPKTLIYRILRKGEVRVNKKRIKPDYKLQAGDLVRVPPIRLSEAKTPAKVSDNLRQLVDSSILYEDDDLMVINKPSGLAVHGGSGISLGLIETVRQMRPDARFLELVHRLDRDTSGCIMVAKKRSALRFLHAALQAKKITKIYHALVDGKWSSRKTKVDAPLQKNELKSGERIVKPHPMGKASLTEYKVLQRFDNVATLVEARPITGRTHQIRVHCLFAGHAIIGDDKYGADETNREMKEYGIKRLFLHAAELRVPLPSGGRKIFHAPLGNELEAGIKKLKKSCGQNSVR
ncbi:23S rRNA pseudouridine(955/2504/2580) synthase RluC [Amphritea balenae]|uniref:Pseudouridine synthase n=1 Tax=Amphritea balenae TaxID=452629 RepID=A0A3P1SVV1_9GAMM|nr:23S rRNA pseudouridine(955/2504/2580) synthase RluC [Amphritea balenae]RRD00676.1 23S rRNA pseudouridine(955/2504/2580) synthase RluC [Amphritea balenae]GGK68804.1 ribosomal large subunit pseudouridine synthase C [Amphritea balenae]